MFGKKGRARRADRKQGRRDNRAQKKSDRRDARAARIDQRQMGRSERAGIRSETKQAAYDAGINPNQFISDGFSAAAEVGGAYFDAKKSMFGTQPAFDGNQPPDKKQREAGQTDDRVGGGGSEAMMPLALAGLGAYMLMKK